MPNSEYPDLPFIPPRAFGRGRPAPPRVIVIHYTAGSERSTSAEDGAAYDQRRTDGTSCHYFADQNSVVQCVYTWDRANSALYNGNRIGIQYELCGTQQTRAQWLDADSDATLTNAARQAARDATRYGIPVRHLTPAQVRAGGSGFCGHDTITLAYPEDHGDHMDPGAEFPWDVFLARVQQFIGGATPQPVSPREGKEMYDKLSATNKVTGGSSPAVGGPGNSAFLRLASFWGDSRVVIDIRGGGLPEALHFEETVKDGPGFLQKGLPDGAVFSVVWLSGREEMTFCTVETLRNVS